ncbi:flagellar biosynthesis anti-sigma factor FlgM [Mitsuaria sp. GD03876]|uniref:flagellar biosynthesis anti-sigma factor FlgM n=1 Tax=Mitsuaria sp. GD03876 TaxID=2975399 RepID=UPI00244CA0A4|nr:flagellar biosynthesis anti-sigma factor FlgM [Mitsuaria sp. GD03876]MDH0868348.1 flagellar biosynthesis anti-sigma factor FlgM [Mitsuaria sp. GD03876]
MKITGSNPLNPAAGTGAATSAAVEATDRAPAPGASGPAMRAAGLETALLKPAQAALAEMPEVDEVKVAALRDALAKGEIKFDANRLSQLIQRYHGGRS